MQVHYEIGCLVQVWNSAQCLWKSQLLSSSHPAIHTHPQQKVPAQPEINACYYFPALVAFLFRHWYTRLLFAIYLRTGGNKLAVLHHWKDIMSREFFKRLMLHALKTNKKGKLWCRFLLHAYVIAKPHLATGDVFFGKTITCKRTVSKNSERNEIPFLTPKNNKYQHYEVAAWCGWWLNTKLQISSFSSL